MEIELKLAIPDAEIAEKIINDPRLMERREDTGDETGAGWEKVRMAAVYYDTEDRILAKNDYTYRVRREGDSVMATLKWGGSMEDGMARRQEINVPADREDGLMIPEPELFRESEVGSEFLALLKDKTLQNMLEMHFLRQRMRLDDGENVMEIAIDQGEIITDYGNEPISELEIELFTGDERAVRELGNELIDRYKIVPELQSKYARGLALIKRNREEKTK